MKPSTLEVRTLGVTLRAATLAGASLFSRAVLLASTALFGGAVLLSCEFERGDRWVRLASAELSCTVGTTICRGGRLEACSTLEEGIDWTPIDDCGSRDLICSTQLKSCALCEPGTRDCDGDTPRICNAEGDGWERLSSCEERNGNACRAGSCLTLCNQARARRSNVGCEYWAVDLDNANVSSDVNAAAQQFAVVVSNPHPDVSAYVTVELDDTEPGEENAPVELLTERIGPRGLRVFPLGPREVDGSRPGEFNTGTHTALTRAAYRVTSSVPVVAYQFNPLDNVGVFSNDASLMKPVESLIDDGTGVRPAYVVLGWPQTIASTDDPLTNFAGDGPDLRAFLTLVGTRTRTTVRVTPTARTLGAPGVPETRPGETLELVLDPFDVLNLETDDFNADLTGTLIETNGPVVVYSGSEASDAPWFRDLSERQCCADHLEDQLPHLRTAGKRFVAPVAYNRSLAVRNAGGGIGVVPAPETFRVIAVSERGARVRTSLRGAREFELEGRGDFRSLVTTRDLLIESDEPVMVASITSSQGAAGVPRTLPGGDPSFMVLPPVEQFRNDYVFLTPQFYAFDFLRIIAPPSARIVLDQRPIEELSECSRLDPPEVRMALEPEDQGDFTVYRCQLSFPVIDPSSDAEQLLRDGRQNDGVHTIESDQKIGVLVDGFDRNVSYAYPAGTELEHLVPR